MTGALASLAARLAETAPGQRVETGPGPHRPVHAYDASNYRVAPRAVASPRAVDDVIAVLRASALCTSRSCCSTTRRTGQGSARPAQDLSSFRLKLEQKAVV